MSLSATIEMVRTRWASRADYAKNAFIFMMILAVCVLSSATYARNAIWKDSVSLCKDNVRKSPNKARPYHHLALAYDEQGRVEEAIGAYKTALKINYAFSSDTYNNLGVDYEKQGRMEEAIYAYKTALQFKYDDADIHYNLANAYVKQGRIEEAISEYKTALVFRPDDAKVHYFLGIAYTKQGRIEEAISEYQIVVNLNPNDAGTRKKIDGLNERMKLMKDRR
jgi:tetratricopeptide (TPR) repeat protein